MLRRADLVVVKSEVNPGKISLRPLAKGSPKTVLEDAGFRVGMRVSVVPTDDLERLVDWVKLVEAALVEARGTLEMG